MANANAASEANALVRRATNVDHRPWVYIDNARLTGEMWNDPGDSELRMGIALTLKNIGRTPAVDVKVRAYGFHDGTVKWGLRRAVERAFTEYEEDWLPPGTVVFPAGTIAIERRAIMRPVEYGRGGGGRISPVVAGVVTYSSNPD
jgi:hypothetical protein